MKENQLNKIHQIDCMDFMKTLPDNCIDCIVTSPPYNKGKPKVGTLEATKRSLEW